MVGPVKAARLAVHRLEQVNPPDRAAGLDRHGRVDRPLELTAVEDPQLKADAVLGPLLPRMRIGVEEVDVADHDADFLEHESLEHMTTFTGSRPGRRPGQARVRRFSLSPGRRWHVQQLAGYFSHCGLP
jgi:hypothetical protein